MISLVAKKIGMSHIYMENGSFVPFTMVKLYDSCVLEVKLSTDGKNYDKILIGYDNKNIKKVSKSVAGVFIKKDIPIHKKIYGCNITKNAQYKVGDSILAPSLLKQGDLLDVSGISTGKGFAGVMKRHNFRGLEASHGVSVSHRSHGSTGQRQDPGKVFKGKKMAGHMGVDRVTVKNLEVLVFDEENNTIAIKGAIPGTNGSDVIIKISN